MRYDDATMFRSSLHADVLTARDHIESVYRSLGETDAASCLLTVKEYQRLRALARTAYETLTAMEAISDPEALQGP